MRGAARLLATILAALAFSACGEERGPSTPAEAFAAVRAAIAAKDGAALSRLFDAESVASFRAMVREWRALLERGDDPAGFLTGMPIEAEELRRGTEEDVVALMVPRRSQLMTEAKWYLEATVVASSSESPDTALLVLRGPDGKEREAWFVRERGSWHYDNYRTMRQW